MKQPYVSTLIPQDFTAEEKQQGRDNINAAASSALYFEAETRSNRDRELFEMIQSYSGQGGGNVHVVQNDPTYGQCEADLVNGIVMFQQGGGYNPVSYRLSKVEDRSAAYTYSIKGTQKSSGPYAQFYFRNYSYNGSVYQGYFNLEIQSYKMPSYSGASQGSMVQYPSIKCMEDYVQDQLPDMSQYATQSYVAQQTSGFASVGDVQSEATERSTADRDLLELIQQTSGSGSQVQADWTETNSGAPSFIQHKPSLGAVATSNDYDDLDDKPWIHFTSAAYMQASDMELQESGCWLNQICQTADYNDLYYQPIKHMYFGIPTNQLTQDDINAGYWYVKFETNTRADHNFVMVGASTIQMGSPLEGRTFGVYLRNHSNTDPADDVCIDPSVQVFNSHTVNNYTWRAFKAFGHIGSNASSWDVILKVPVTSDDSYWLTHTFSLNFDVTFIGGPFNKPD